MLNKTRKIKSPIKKGVAKVPVIMQLEALECGAACLAMILAYYDKWIPLEQVRIDCGVSRDGSNAFNVLKAANSYGLECHAYKFGVEDVKKEAIYPCIIHWNFNHFVVLDGFKFGRAYLNDPGKGEYSVSMKEFDEAYTGICVVFFPNENFVPSGEKKSIIKMTKKWLKGTGNVMLFTVLISIVNAIITAVNPQISKIFLDDFLTNKTEKLFLPFFVFLIIFSICQIIISAINDIYNRRLEGKTAIVNSMSYMWKILHLPMDFFSQRMAGDIQQRQSQTGNITNTLVNTIAPMFLNMVMIVFYFCIMIRYSVLLTFVGIAATFINLYVSRVISKQRMNITRSSLINGAKLSSYTVAGIEEIETIKSSGAENGFFSKWAGYQAASNEDKVRALSLSFNLGLIPQFVQEVANYVVLIVGVYIAMEGHFTLGIVMAFQGYLSAFMGPTQTLINSSNQIQEMRTDMERIDDVMEYKNDDIFGDIDSNDIEDEYKKLTGNLEIKNLFFGYSRLDEPVIKDFNLKLEAGKSVAVVGQSGCGKSTISKLIGGLYKPWSGEITFDGKKHNEIDKTIFASSVAMVDQDILFYEGSVSENIKMWDKTIEDYEMILAAKDAQVLDVIYSKNASFEHKLLNNANDFSGGEKQRIEIARVLAQDPRILILDEATSALDAKTEYEVVDMIKKRGISCIVIAHRLSTIRSCDEIIVLEDGVIVDRGTHDYLMESCETYKTLVINE